MRFELTEPVKAHLISSQTQSTTLPSLQKREKIVLFSFSIFFFNIFQFKIFYASKEEVPVNLIDPGFGFLPIENSRFPTATLPSFTFSGNTPSFGWIN